MKAIDYWRSELDKWDAWIVLKWNVFSEQMKEYVLYERNNLISKLQKAQIEEFDHEI